MNSGLKRTLPTQRSPVKGNTNQGRFSRTPQERNLKNQSVKRSAADKSFLASIGSSRQADRSKPIQINKQSTKKQSHNHSMVEQPIITDERRTPVLYARSHNNSIEHPAQRKILDESNWFENEDPEEQLISEQNDLKFYAGKPNITQDRSMHRITSHMDPNETNDAKKAYGQYLLNQMKAKENKKNIEMQQKWEEDRQMLNYNPFLDGFGRSREKFMQKHRSNMLQPVGVVVREDNTPVPPLAFDKIHNHTRNYNLYPLEDGLDLFLIRQNNTSISPLPPSIRKQQSKITLNQNRELNRTVEPHYHKDLLHSPADYDSSVIGIKPSDSQRPNIHLREKPSVGGLTWKPSTDRITTQNDQLKSYITKLEYQKILDQQVLEKQLQKAYEQKVLEMEDMIEHLRFERDKISQERLDNPVSPNRKPGHRLFDPSNSLPPYDGNRLENIAFSFNNNSSRKNTHRGAGGGGATIFLQPGDSNLRSIRSSKKILFDEDNIISSRRELQDRAAHLDNLIYGDPRGHKRAHTHFVGTKKSPDYLKPSIIKQSESKQSLVNETRFVPIDPYQAARAERLLPPNHRNRSPLNSSNEHHEKYFPHPKIIHNNLTLESPSLKDLNDRIGSNLDKMSIDKLTNIENSVKYQNSELKKEIRELKDKITKLADGTRQDTEYDSIRWRLNRIKDEGDDMQSNYPTSYQYQSSANRNPYITNTSSNRNFDPRTLDPRERMRRFDAGAQISVNLKRRYSGIKRNVRTGEEPFQKKFYK